MSLDVSVTVLKCRHCKAHYEILGVNGTTMPYIKNCPHCGSGDVDVEVVNLDDRDDG